MRSRYRPAVARYRRKPARTSLRGFASCCGRREPNISHEPSRCEIDDDGCGGARGRKAPCLRPALAAGGLPGDPIPRAIRDHGSIEPASGGAAPVLAPARAGTGRELRRSSFRPANQWFPASLVAGDQTRPAPQPSWLWKRPASTGAARTAARRGRPLWRARSGPLPAPASHDAATFTDIMVRNHHGPRREGRHHQAPVCSTQTQPAPSRGKNLTFRRARERERRGFEPQGLP